MSQVDVECIEASHYGFLNSFFSPPPKIVYQIKSTTNRSSEQASLGIETRYRIGYLCTSRGICPEVWRAGKGEKLKKHIGWALLPADFISAVLNQCGSSGHMSSQMKLNLKLFLDALLRPTETPKILLCPQQASEWPFWPKKVTSWYPGKTENNIFNTL